MQQEALRTAARRLQAAAQVDEFNLVPELRRDPLRIEVGAVGIVQSRWPKLK